MSVSDAQLTVKVHLGLDEFELSVELDAGAGVTGIFGASGAGKSSLLEIIAGLRRHAVGRVALGNEVWLDTERHVFVPPHRRGIGYVPQEGLLFPHWNVRRNLMAGHRRAEEARHSVARRSEAPGSEETLRRVIDLLELGSLLNRMPITLSGGERQRVALGRAICSGARLLLLDEPLAALDLPLRRKLLPFLRRLRDEFTVPMFMISHDPNEVQALCDDLVVLHRGKILARGVPRQVLTDPAVYSLAEHQGFENVLPGRVMRSDNGVSEVRLGDAVDLVVLGTSSTDTEVLVGLPASEVILATEQPRGLSARNLIEARLSELRQLDRHVLVTAEIGAGVPPLTVEITKATPSKLGLEVGRRVFLVIKAASCRIYGADR